MKQIIHNRWYMKCALLMLTRALISYLMLPLGYQNVFMLVSKTATTN